MAGEACLMGKKSANRKVIFSYLVSRTDKGATTVAQARPFKEDIVLMFFCSFVGKAFVFS